MVLQMLHYHLKALSLTLSKHLHLEGFLHEATLASIRVNDSSAENHLHIVLARMYLVGRS